MGPVAVRVDLPGGTASRGSGYAIGKSLVLSAGHILVGQNLTVVDTYGHSASARPIWSRYDVALLEVTDPRWQTGLDTSVRWGRFTSSLPGQRCEARGFPRFQKRDGTHDVEHLLGHINPATGEMRSLYQISIDDSIPDRMWNGMSGAAVFCNKLLVGVLIAEPKEYSHARLEAVPVARLISDQEFCAIITDRFAEPAVLESVELSDLFSVPQRRRDTPSPAFLLRADVEGVRFRGREDNLKRLMAWCDAPGFGARLLVGPGGQGKTRLTRELVARLQAIDWTAGHLSSAKCDNDILARIADTSTPLLIVADYAETRIDEVRRLVEAALSGRHVRLLLVARTAGDWWAAMRAASPQLEIALYSSTVEELGPLDQDVEGRVEAFGQALEDFAAKTKAVNCDMPAPANLGASRYNSVLSVQMAALVRVLENGNGKAAPQQSTSLEDVLLAHERRYWTNAAKDRGLALQPITCQRAVAVAALCGASNEQEAQKVLATVRGLEDQTADVLIGIGSWLHDLYPQPEGGYWGSLQPDVLAEHLVVATYRESADQFQSAFKAMSASQARTALTVLSRAAVHQDDLASQLRRALRTNPTKLAPIAVQIACQAEEPRVLRDALDQLVRGSSISLRFLAEIFDTLPKHSDALAHFAVDLGEILAARLRQHSLIGSEHYQSYFARILRNLADYMRYLDRNEDALEASREALEISRRLAAQGGEPYLPSLASSLASYSISMGASGQAVAALECNAEAVDIYRRLASEDRYYRTRLATSLANRAVRLAALNRGDEALEPIAEAIKIYRQLVVEDDSLGTNLAHALNVLDTRLYALGHKSRALEAITESVNLHRELARAAPDFYLKDLAQALRQLAIGLGDFGRHQDALEAGDEAVRIYRELAAKNPESHLPGLAYALQVLARRHRNLDEHDQALEEAAEAVDIGHSLVESGASGSWRGLAGSLELLSAEYFEVGDFNAALQALDEAIAIYADSGFKGDLAAALADKAAILVSANLYEEAIETLNDAVAAAAESRNERALISVFSLMHNEWPYNVPNHLSGEWLDIANRVMDMVFGD